MSRDRYQEIWRFLHLANNAMRDPADKLFKLRSFIAFISDKFQSVYVPTWFSVDESMVKWKGRLAWRQYMPQKPIKFGMKVWALCESTTGYMSNFQVYTGKEQGREEVGLACRVVQDLCSKIHFSNARVCFDNFYTGVPLLNFLKSVGIFAWGTVRKNRKGLPTDEKKDKTGKTDKKDKSKKKTAVEKKTILKKHEYKIYQKDDLLWVNWKDTKEVGFLSNFHSPLDMGMVKRRGENHRRKEVDVPKVVSDYQTHMRGVDLCDQNIGYYLPTLKSVKWWRRLFFYIVQVSVMNSYILAKACHPNSIKRKFPHQRDFIEQLATELIGEYRNLKPVQREPVVIVSHRVYRMFDKRKVCVECALVKRNTPAGSRTTYYGCGICNVRVHMACEELHRARMARDGIR